MLRPAVLALAVLPGSACAFGFFVAGGDEVLINEAAQVVLMREGTRTVTGEQDLIVHILSREDRYEAANFPNVTIPTNIDLTPAAKDEFAPFYASLFDKTLKWREKAVVTEYAWDSASCDPCTTAALGVSELLPLGMDVINGGAPFPVLELKNRDQLSPDEAMLADGFIREARSRVSSFRPAATAARFVITRLHFRYDKSSLTDDLVFKAAPAIAGGREFRVDGLFLEEGSAPSPTNYFQARYAIRHAWPAATTCWAPRRAQWSLSPPDGGPAWPETAEDLGLVKWRSGTAKLIESPVPELGLEGSKEHAGFPVTQ